MLEVVQDWEKRLQQGASLASRQLYHIALEFLRPSLVSHCPDDILRARLYYEIGKIDIALGDYKQGVFHFSNALSSSHLPLDLEARCRINLAVAYRYVDYDKAYRLLTETLENFGDQLPPALRGALYNNLGDVQWLNGFYSEGFQSVKKSLDEFGQAGLTSLYDEVYNNLGVFCLEFGRYEEAEAYLSKVLEFNETSRLYGHAELSRLYLMRNDIQQSVHHAQKALPLVWSSVMNNAKHEVSRLCRLLALLVHRMGEYTMALRLLEKSQLLFGQLEMWREWQQVQAEMDDWLQSEDTPRRPQPGLEGVRLDEIQQFLMLLEVMNAQELLTPKFAALLDTRVLYARAFANFLGIGPKATEDIVYACRFADYGLTAIEPEVLANPTRSSHAWEQYQQHPLLSVKMLDSLQLPRAVLAIIEDHHEHPDGSGYPRGKQESEINPMSQILAIADYYSTEVTVRGKPHSVAISEIENLAGTHFTPELVNAFTSMFTHE
ncbi:HD domain-containing phosphohydrolase [Alicyclobacillus macrosporangiidus]|uniref:HD domain-containing phosphohydrolase n=1 Tax=Alicyclobacillus macrosporangiidus TaxID=392015 RepID=UPI00068A187F|nr:HD domain-containing phosphohydrolase [Alicyclobacillus macrosporangiidus]